MSALTVTSMGRNGYIHIKKLEDNEKITPCCYHSLDGGRTLKPIVNIDTIGQKPSDFSSGRSFWKVVQISAGDFEMFDD